jgi:hypothetical protein
MILRLVYLFAAGVSLAMCLALPSAAQAAATDQVTLIVHTRAVDGAILFADPSNGWSWHCVNSGLKRCSIQTERGRTITLTAESGAASSLWSWDGPCASAGTTCTLRVNDTEVSLTATFSARLYLTTFGAGSISREKVPSGTLYRRACSGWTGSDFCGVYAYGEKILLRARPTDADWRMIGWGGTCSNVSSGSNCPVTMNATQVATATFDLYCPPGERCGEGTSLRRFEVQIVGAGTVVARAPRIRILDPRTCTSFDSAGLLCSNLSGPRDGWMDIKALPLQGRRFLGWSGPCSGTGTLCHFRNVGGIATIYAKFG